MSEGEEVLYVIEGQIEFYTPMGAEILKPGDTLYFDTGIPHAFRGLGAIAARAIVVFAPEGSCR